MIKMNLVEALVSKACLAPSSHNTQPWLFEAHANELRLYADRTKALSVNDPDDRELTISCGCALMNLRVAATELDTPLVVESFPDENDPDYLARISSGSVLDDTLTALSPAISKRRTYRKKFETDVPAEGVICQLVESCQAEGAWLEPIGTEDHAAVGRLVAEGDASQWEDRHWRRELASWMHPRRTGDGLTLPWLAIPAAQIVVRTFDMGKGVGAKDSGIAEHSPALMVLGTEKDGPMDWLKAGQALERVLLAATNAGLQASFLNQPIQVSHLRNQLQAVCKHAGEPQILLRLGYPPDEIPATPRRLLSEVFSIAA